MSNFGQKWNTMRFEGLTQKDEGIEKNEESEHKRTKIESSRSSTTTHGVTVAQGRPATHVVSALVISFHFYSNLIFLKAMITHLHTSSFFVPQYILPMFSLGIASPLFFLVYTQDFNIYNHTRIFFTTHHLLIMGRRVIYSHHLSISTFESNGVILAIQYKISFHFPCILLIPSLPSRTTLISSSFVIFPDYYILFICHLSHDWFVRKGLTPSFFIFSSSFKKIQGERLRGFGKDIILLKNPRLGRVGTIFGFSFGEVQAFDRGINMRHLHQFSYIYFLGLNFCYYLVFQGSNQFSS